MKKIIILSCVATLTLISLVGCSCDQKHSSTCESSATTMTPDTKDMSHADKH